MHVFCSVWPCFRDVTVFPDLSNELFMTEGNVVLNYKNGAQVVTSRHYPLHINYMYTDCYCGCWRTCQPFIKEFVFLASGRLITCGNVAYVFLFGWWVSLAYFLVGILMFITIAGVSYGRSANRRINDLYYWSDIVLIHFFSHSSGKLCWKLSCYFLWPFGKSIHEVHFGFT